MCCVSHIIEFPSASWRLEWLVTSWIPIGYRGFFFWKCSATQPTTQWNFIACRGGSCLSSPYAWIWGRRVSSSEACLDSKLQMNLCYIVRSYNIFLFSCGFSHCITSFQILITYMCVCVCLGMHVPSESTGIRWELPDVDQIQVLLCFLNCWVIFPAPELCL